MVTNVRNAKAKLSELLARAAAGEEVVITSDGQPKAKLVAIEADRRPFRVNHALLRIRPRSAIPSADRLVRQDCDGRD